MGAWDHVQNGTMAVTIETDVQTTVLEAAFLYLDAMMANTPEDIPTADESDKVSIKISRFSITLKIYAVKRE